MAVVIGPPRRSLLRRVAIPVISLALIAGVVYFLVYRFGDTPVEKAEKLFARRDLTTLLAFVQKRLAAGEKNPLLYAYYAVAEFSVNRQANLKSVLANIEAVDARPVFRREALVRILQLEQNRTRAAEIMDAALHLENPVGAEMKQFLRDLVQADISLAGDAKNFGELKALFPEALRVVHAKKLQWRRAPSTEGEVIRQLENGEELLLRQSGAATQVSGKKGHWALALDSAMDSGWVFDAYLTRKAEE